MPTKPPSHQPPRPTPTGAAPVIKRLAVPPGTMLPPPASYDVTTSPSSSSAPPGVPFEQTLAEIAATQPLASMLKFAPPGTTETAVVITGAVTQGAFAAGALEVLARRNVPISRVVATSAGALTGTFLAAGIYAGRVDQAATALVDLWTRDANWRNALDLSARDALRGRGLSTTRSLRRVLCAAVESIVPGDRQAVELRLIATALQGNPQVRRLEGATSAEAVFRFIARDFETRSRRDHIYDAAMASAAFPGLYAPQHVPGVGDCIDGGAVNNAAIKHALEGSNVGRVIVIANTPRLTRTPRLAGASLVEHVAGTLIHERLYRDLREAHHVNHQLDALDSLVTCKMLDARQLAAVKLALGWQGKRRLQLVEIRPEAPLRGGVFTALSDRGLREEYIEEGRRAAEETLTPDQCPGLPASHIEHSY